VSAKVPPSSISYDSILLKHDAPVSRAFLLLHGLTASPLQFAEFGRVLHLRGANVYIPRLPHHGLSDRLTTELKDLTAQELRSFALQSAAFAQTLGPRLTVVGFSLGGLLAAFIAQNVPVERATCIAPFLGVAWLPGRMTGRAARMVLMLPNRFMWWDPVLRERLMPEHGYPRFATHAVAHAASLARELMHDAELRAPAARDVQIVLNQSETTVNNRAVRKLAALWSARKGGIVLHRLKGLPLSHDIIEPLHASGLAPHVYPALLDLVDR